MLHVLFAEPQYLIIPYGYNYLKILKMLLVVGRETP